jgi:hypothetical protein
LTLAKSTQTLGHPVRRSGVEESDHWHRRLLRARRDRPRRRCAADKGEELAPLETIELHLGPLSARAKLQDIEQARIGQRI